MVTMFIVDDDLCHLYLTTSVNYSEVLQELHIEPNRVTFWTIPFELLEMVWDNKVKYVMREH